MKTKDSSANRPPDTSTNDTPEPGGFAILPKGLLKVWPYMPEHHLRLLPLLLSFWSKSGPMFPAQGLLGALAGVSRQQANQTLDELVSVGMLTKSPRRRKDGFNSTCEYHAANWDAEDVQAAIIAAYRVKFPRRRYAAPKWVKAKDTKVCVYAHHVQVPVDSRCQVAVDSRCQVPLDRITDQTNGPAEQTIPPLAALAFAPGPPQGGPGDNPSPAGGETVDIDPLEAIDWSNVPGIEAEAVEDTDDDATIDDLDADEAPPIPAALNFRFDVTDVPEEPAPVPPVGGAGAVVEMIDVASMTQAEFDEFMAGVETERKGKRLQRHVRQKERAKAGKRPRRQTWSCL